VVAEASARQTKYGLVFDGDGWFVLNARETRWRDDGRPFGVFCDFEGKRRFKQIGISLYVLAPGEMMSMYHRERAQEAFLVLAGECVLIVEDEERTFSAWDFFHCPGGTDHTIIGAGDAPAVVLAVGARGGRKGYVYPVAASAHAHEAAVEEETTKPAGAYAPFPHSKRTVYESGWLPDL